MPEINEHRIEAVVDAVAEALGVDTGTLQEDKFKAACKAAWEALTPSAPGYLSVSKDGLHVSLFRSGDKKEKESATVVRTLDELKEWCMKWGVDNFMCSSSVDFPEDSTDDPEVIALCREIRG